MFIRFLKLNPHCALFNLLQALFRTGSKKILPNPYTKNKNFFFYFKLSFSKFARDSQNTQTQNSNTQKI